MRERTLILILFLGLTPVGTGGAAENSAPDPALAVPAGTLRGEDSWSVCAFSVACPQPSALAASLRFELTRPEHVTLRIYDAAGHLVRGLLDEERPAGFQAVAWNGRDQSGNDLDEGRYYALLGVAGRYEVRTLSLDHPLTP